MTSDPYKSPQADTVPPAEGHRLATVFLALSTVLVLVLAGWCFYLSQVLSAISAADSDKIEQLEQIAERVRSRDADPERATVIEYFDVNREFLLDDVRYQRSAQLNFIVVGTGLVLIVLVQGAITISIRRRHWH